jgi:hypothetical protein
MEWNLDHAASPAGLGASHALLDGKDLNSVAAPRCCAMTVKVECIVLADILTAGQLSS